MDLEKFERKTDLLFKIYSRILATAIILLLSGCSLMTGFGLAGAYSLGDVVFNLLIVLFVTCVAILFPLAIVIAIREIIAVKIK